MMNRLFANPGKVNTIAAGRRHTVGLKSDGTVTAVGDNRYGRRARIGIKREIFRLHIDRLLADNVLLHYNKLLGLIKRVRI